MHLDEIEMMNKEKSVPPNIKNVSTWCELVFKEYLLSYKYTPGNTNTKHPPDKGFSITG